MRSLAQPAFIDEDDVPILTGKLHFVHAAKAQLPK
jgi:hypothetical protein